LRGPLRAPSPWQCRISCEPLAALRAAPHPGHGTAIRQQVSHDYAHLHVLPSLPLGLFHPSGGEDVLRRMSGATILRIGGTDEADLDGGGFIIDYRPAESKEIWRVVLAFHERGMWVVHDDMLPIPAAARE